MSTTPGETKNIVDALRRALQGPVSTMASGGVTAGGSFTLSLQPSSFQAPGSQVESYQSTVDVASVGGFSGTVTLTEVDTLTAAGGSVAFLSTTLTSVSTITVQVSSPSPAGDGLASLNILVAATTPQGSYTVTVTGTSLNNGVTQTASAILTVVVGAGTTKCVNDKDCGTGCSCLNGLCDCIVDNTPLGCGPNVATGTGSNPCNTPKWTQVCSGEGVGPPFTNNGCCYCGPKKPSDCAQYTAACQAIYGPSSVSQYVCSAAGCGCFCSRPKSKPSNFTVTCPSSPIICINPSSMVAQQAVLQLGVANGDVGNAYNVNMTITPVGNGCACCGAGPSLSTGGGYSIGPGATVQTNIIIPVTCTTAACYQWNVKISVATAITNQIITTISCQIQVCTRIGNCFQVIVNPHGGCPGPCTCNYAGSGTPYCAVTLTGAGCVNGATPQHCGAASRCTGCSQICLPGLQSFDFSLKSIGGYAGTVNWKTSTACQTGGCAPVSGQQILTAGQTVQIAVAIAACVSYTIFNLDALGSQIYYPASLQATCTGTDSVITSSGTGVSVESDLGCA